MTPLEVLFGITVVMVGVFLAIGWTNRLRKYTSSNFFLFGHGLKSKQFGYSHAAASTSLGTVIFFFVTLGVQFGAYILWAPLTLFLGTLLFNFWLLPKIPSYFFDRNDRSFMGTLGEFIEDRFRSRLVSLIVMTISLFGLLAILIIELFVGATLFDLYNIPTSGGLAVFGYVLVVWIYTSLGGMRAVVRTDQLQILFLGVPVILLFVYLLTQHGGLNWINEKALLPYPAISEDTVLLPWPLFLNMAIVNILLLPCLLRTWQMIASTDSRSSVKGGLFSGAIMTAFFTALYVGIGLAIYEGVFSGVDSQPSLADILTKLSLDSNLVGAYLIFPLFAVSCFVAILSTVDSALMPVVHALWYEMIGRNEVSRGRLDPRVLSAPLISAAVLAFALALYFVVFIMLGFDVISWMFTIFSFSIIIAPTVVAALVMREEVLHSKLGPIAGITSLVLAFVVASAFTLIGNRTGNINLIQLNSPAAALVGAIPYATLWLCVKLKKQFQ